MKEEYNIPKSVKSWADITLSKINANQQYPSPAANH